MAIDNNEEIKEIIKEIGQDVEKLREHLTGASKALLKNTQTKKVEEKVTALLIKQNEELRDTLKENNLLSIERGKVIDKNIETIKEHSKATKSATTGWFNWKKALWGVIKWLGKAAIAVVETGIEFGKTAGNIKTFGDLVAAGADDIPGLGKVLKVFGKELDDRTQMFKGLAQSGATFSSSLVEMGDQAYKAGMPLVQFQELIQNNTSTMARLFGTVNQGIPEIAKMGRQLKKFTMDELSGFGITMDETNQFMTTYAEIERARGRAGRLTWESLRDGTKAYAKNLTTLSRLTGESVDAIDKRNRGIAADGVFQAKMAQMSEDQQQRVYAAMKLLPESAQQAAKEFIGMGVPIGDAAKGLAAFGGGQFESALLAFTNATGKFTETDLLRLSNEFKSLGTGVIRTGDAMASAAFVGNNMAGEAANIFSDMAGTIADEEKFLQQSQAALVGNTRNLVKMPDQLGLIHAELQDVNTNLIKALVLDEDSMGGKALDSFTSGTTKWSGKIKDSLNKVINKLWGLDDDGVAPDPSNFGMSSDFSGAMAQHGTHGFKEFGQGTPVMLHGKEAVVPENTLLGSAISMLETIANKSASTASTTNVSETTNTNKFITNDNQKVADLKQLTTVSSDILKSSTNIESHLNKLIAINMATERNTKTTNKELADMSGTLV